MRFFFIVTLLLGFFTPEIKAQYTLWGMTSNGGTDNIGSLFSITTGSSSISSQYSFTYTNPGQNPVHTNLIQTSTGKVFGMTSAGGTSNLGVLFEYDIAGNIYNRKINFSGLTNGSHPQGSLVEFTSTGKLYGLTQDGGVGGVGVLFEFDPTTNIFTKKFDFDGPLNGSNPHGSLVRASNNKLYGMTYNGGANGFGVLFEYDPSTNIFTKKLDFNGAVNGKNPNASLIMAADLKLYGMTQFGGTTGQGVLFQYDPIANVYIKKIDFNGVVNGQNPKGSLFEASTGKLYGLTSAGGSTGAGVLFEYNITTGICSKKFDMAAATGSTPNGDLIEGSAGKLYGMTYDGGAGAFGVMFEYDILSDNYNVKVHFVGLGNGKYPKGSLLKSSSGKLYALTTEGGAVDAGVLYEFDVASSTYTKKLDLNLLNEGANPNGGLNMVSFGTKFYGMTNTGGANNLGTIFEWDPRTATLTTEISFSGAGDGANPFGSLVEISGGRLCGMTKKGGTSDKGVLFTYNPVSKVFTKLVDFDGATKGSNPYGDVLVRGDKLYGLTNTGGVNDFGVLFEYNLTSSTYTKKVDFDGASKGKNPFGSLAYTVVDGFLYGVTYAGGSNNEGVLFSYDPALSVYTKKIDFNAATKGANPQSSLLAQSAGLMVGMTTLGGSLNKGTVFIYNVATGGYTLSLSLTGASFGSTPYGTFIETAGGDMYAMTNDGGTSNLGTIILSHYTGGSLTVIKQLDFTGLPNGKNPVYGKFIEECWLPLKASAITASNTICQGSTTVYSLSIDPIVNATSYTWTPPPGGIILSGIGTNSVTMSYSAVAAGVYTVGAYGWNYCGDGISSVITLTINPTPTVSISASSLAVCANTSNTLSASGALTYSWSNGALTNNTIVNPTVTTNYTVVGTSLGCSDTKTISITVNPSPTLAVTPTNYTMCEGNSITFSASGATTYSWSSGPTTATVSVSPISSTIYTVTGSSFGCTDSRTVSVIINPKPVITFSAPTSTICKGTLFNMTVYGADTYTWSTGEKTSTVSVAPEVSTTYTAIGTGTNGCVASNTVLISVIPSSGTLTVPTSIIMCSGKPFNIKASGSSVYLWSTGEITDNITINPASNTVCTVTGTDEVGCSYTKTINVSVKPSPTVYIGPDVEMTLGSSFQFNPTQTSAVSYLWSPSTELSNPNSIDPTTTTLADITYTLTVTSLNGCKASDDVFVKITNSLIIANYVSPNGDGLNDTWKISVPRAVKDYKIQIFDGWSNLVYSTNSNYNNDWSASDVPDGIYYYVITEGVNIKYKGTITVTR